MRMLSQLIALCTTAVLVACSASTASLPPDGAPIVTCGNGQVEAGEGCDDGNGTSGDGCDVNCRPTACGNGVVTMNEGCDDDNTLDGDGCDRNCMATGCGNGIVTGAEACDDGNLTNDDGCDSNCTITACGNGVVTSGEACDDRNLTNWDGCNSDCTNSALAYVKASNTASIAFFGHSVAVSADGSTLAVGAPSEDSAATGIDGNQADNSAPSSGAVYVFVRSGTTWMQQAYVKPSNTGPGYEFGRSIALSADGSALAVGAWLEDSAATGVDGDQADTSAEDAGAVYVFTRNGTTWSQQAYVKASNTDPGDVFGWNVALSGDGSTLAVSAIGEDSSATGIDGDQVDDTAFEAGAVYVFTRSGTTWSQQAYVKASNTGPSDHLGSNDLFGWSVALSSDGSMLAVGAISEDSAATGVDGNQADDSAWSAGAVYVFKRTGMTWSQQAYLKASNTGTRDRFGSSVAMSADGTTLVVGAFGEASAATGIDGDQVDDTAFDAGAVYVFVRSSTSWSQQAYVKASNTDSQDLFGWSIALSTDGSFLAVGSRDEYSAATGIDGDQADNSAYAAGAVYVFTRSGITWSQHAYVKASNTDSQDLFGWSLALSGDGSTLAVGAIGEASPSTGVGGNRTGNSAHGAGAAYVFR